MKLLRWGMAGAEKPGLLDANGRVRDLSAVLPDLTGESLDPDVLAALRNIDPASLPELPADIRLGACVGAGGKIVGIGLNYADHVREAKMQIPAEPLVFMKTCRPSGPQDPLWLPPGHRKVDWEIELAVVIGRDALCIDESVAMSHVAGYASFIDFSERAWQLEGSGQWVKGKSFPSFAPIGPWLVSADEVPDPHALRLWLEVNGERVQDGNTREMIFRVPQLIAAISHWMPLHAGDIIATGTPPGVGMGRDPQRWLKRGDRVRAGVVGLGEQEHLCLDWCREPGPL